MPESKISSAAEIAAHVVILAGGIGSRFWPLSTPSRPKQLLPLVGESPLIRQTVERVRPAVPVDRIRIITGAALAGRTLGALPGLLPAHILAEPRARGTAPALVWAAHTIAAQDPDAVMVSLHADHSIEPAEAFRALLAGLVERARKEDLLFTVGAVPDRPETGYGYIRPGEILDGEPEVSRVEAFVEKPDGARAESMVAEGCLWNTGIFVWRAGLLLDEVRRHTPELAGALDRLDAGDTKGFFDAVPSINIDPAVLERSDRVAVARATFAWDDVGTWEAAARTRETDPAGNVLHGDAHVVDGRDCVVWADDGAVVVFGASDLLVVRTGEVTLVVPRDRASDLKSLLERLPDRLRDPE